MPYDKDNNNSVNWIQRISGNAGRKDKNQEKKNDPDCLHSVAHLNLLALNLCISFL